MIDMKCLKVMKNNYYNFYLIILLIEYFINYNYYLSFINLIRDVKYFKKPYMIFILY